MIKESAINWPTKQQHQQTYRYYRVTNEQIESHFQKKMKKVKISQEILRRSTRNIIDSQLYYYS